tara:strand:- start:553 stop:1179 length:627 start_codon:yes stop_codon:yes gene_type:complete
MNIEYIPIGIDCDVAFMCKEFKLRNFAYPFDHIVTYNGITDILKNNFDNFIPEIHENTINNHILNKKYNTKFIHDNFLLDQEKEKYKRRINRFLETLDNYNKLPNNKIIFIKKGHSIHHHNETDNIINEYNEIKDFNYFLKNNYKNLNYEIKIILLCKQCNKNIKDENIENIKLYKYNDIPTVENQFQNTLITKAYFKNLFEIIIIDK